MVFTLGDETGLVSEPIVSMNDDLLVLALSVGREEVIDVMTVTVLDVADREHGAISGNDFVVKIEILVGAAVAMNWVELSGGQNVHKIGFIMLGSVGNNEVNLGTFA